MGNAKTLHKPSTHVNFHDATLVELIKDSSHKFDFGDTPIVPSNNDLIEEVHHSDNDGDTPIIIINL